MGLERGEWGCGSEAKGDMKEVRGKREEKEKEEEEREEEGGEGEGEREEGKKRRSRQRRMGGGKQEEEGEEDEEEGGGRDAQEGEGTVQRCHGRLFSTPFSLIIHSALFQFTPFLTVHVSSCSQSSPYPLAASPLVLEVTVVLAWGHVGSLCGMAVCPCGWPLKVHFGHL